MKDVQLIMGYTRSHIPLKKKLEALGKGYIFISRRVTNNDCISSYFKVYIRLLTFLMFVFRTKTEDFFILPILTTPNRTWKSVTNLRFCRISFCKISFCRISFCKISFYRISFCKIRFCEIKFCKCILVSM